MESKPKNIEEMDKIWRPFNRTSMESKLWQVVDKLHLFALLLIEPVWNRNNPARHGSDNAFHAFNRTSMESKLDPSFWSGHEVPLLIEPVWNRNIKVASDKMPFVFPFNRTSMESKLLAFLEVAGLDIPFNRTSMGIETRCKPTLTVPRRSTFNRTSMESKHQGLFQEIIKRSAFNRTSMESKLRLARFPER